MVQNLDYGTKITGSTEQTDNATVEKYCYNDSEDSCSVYGGLYQWAEAVQYYNGATNSSLWSPVPTDSVQGICPSGWHMASKAEWEQMLTYLGSSTAGGSIKEVGIAHWDDNLGATNFSGFTARGSGYSWGGSFYERKQYFYFWTTSTFIESEDIGYGLMSVWTGGAKNNMDQPLTGRAYGIQASSVRCVRYNPVPETATVGVAIDVNYNNPPTINTKFTSIVNNGGTAPSYQWKVNNVNMGTNSSIFQYFPISDGDKVKCVVTSNISGISGNPATSNTITMLVPGTVTPPSISISASATTVPAGSTVVFTSTTTNVVNTPSYQWKVNGIVKSGATNSTYSYVPLNNDLVVCYLTVDGHTYTSNGIVITISSVITESPSIHISIAENPIIAGGTAVLTSLVSNGGLSDTYQWTKNSIDISGATSRSYSYVPSNSDVITCELTSGSVYTSNSITISVLTPRITITADANPVYALTSVSYVTTVTDAGVSPTYQWTVGGSNISAAILDELSYIPSNGDIIRCVLTVNSISYTSNAITMIVYPVGLPCGTITDSRDGKTYKTIMLGNQCWMQENLDYGTRINVSVTQTNNSTPEKWCYNNDVANCTAYGALYQWNELMDYDSSNAQGICPSGWHIPSVLEWDTLINLFGGSSLAGWELKEQGYTHWNYITPVISNCNYVPIDTTSISLSQFNMRGNGYASNGTSGNLKNKSYTWTSTESHYQHPTVMSTNNSNAKAEAVISYRGYGYGVRCIKD